MEVSFIIWTLFCSLFLIMGIYCFTSKCPAGFWANKIEKASVKDIRGYNYAIGRLWIFYSALIFLCGIPLIFCKQNCSAFIITILGSAFSSLVLALIYVLKVEKKYVTKN